MRSRARSLRGLWRGRRGPRSSSWPCRCRWGSRACSPCSDDAQVQGLLASPRSQAALRAELAGEREPQRVGAAARQVLLVARHAVARAHGAGVELAAVAVVVAHLDGLRQAAARGRRRCRARVSASVTGSRIDVPGRPVEHRLDPMRLGAYRRGARSGTARRRPSAAGRMILPGLNRLSGSSLRLIARESLVDRGPNCHSIHSPRHRPSPCSPLNRRPCTCAPAPRLPRRWPASWRRRRARMSRIGRTCSVPTQAWAYQVPRVPCCAKTSVSAVGVFGQMLERHRAVLDEAHRLAVALEAHHDVEAGLAHLPQRSSGGPASGISTTQPGRPRSAHQLHQPCQPAHRGLRGLRRRTPPAGWPRARPTSARSITGRKDGLWRARSIMVRSTSSTAVGVRPDDMAA